MIFDLIIDVISGIGCCGVGVGITIAAFAWYFRKSFSSFK